MGHITVSINDQTYSLACRDGEEDRLRTLAARVDETARDLSRRLGQVGEARLMLMVALLLADELEEGGGHSGGDSPGRDAEAIRLLDQASAEIEGIVSRLGSA